MNFRYTEQQNTVVNVLENAGKPGTNSKVFRDYWHIQDIPTRVFEINAMWEKANLKEKICKRLEADGTATYYREEYDWKENKSNAKKIKHIEYIGNTARVTYI